jgi:Matrixin
MPSYRARRDRSGPAGGRKRALAPIPEVLEGRLLLYAALGDHFTYDSRITYSFMPDGTSVGGVPSALFSTLNAKFATATWEAQIEQAASIWENAADLNLAHVSDGGQAVGSSGAQQDDPRFGDIRIGAVPLSSGTLAVTFLAPPANGGTDAGDILLNSNINWQVNSNYDLMTVMVHEFGHSLGLGDVSSPTNPFPVMYGNYEGISQALTADDSAGIRFVDGVRQFDAYNINGVRNLSYLTAPNISGSFGSNAQLAIPSLDITTGGDSEWFYVTVPSTTTGRMTVSVQSTNLSSLSPKVMVYNSSLGLVGQALAANSMGATVSVSMSVAANQGYYIKVLAAPGYGAIGSYGLLVNAGSQTQAPIAPPNTYVAQRADQGGGSLTNGVTATGTASTVALPPSVVFTTIGNLSGWAMAFTGSVAATVDPPVQSPPGPVPVPTAPAPSAPIITVAAPSPISVTPIVSAKHHAKVKHHKPPRRPPAVVHRVKLVKDHHKPRSHRSH